MDIERLEELKDEFEEAIEELSQASDGMHYAQDGAHVKIPISLATIDLAITALQKIGTNTVDVSWTEAYQSYESAGDEAVPYCPKCDADIEDYQKFCKDCGVELIWSWDKENT